MRLSARLLFLAFFIFHFSFFIFVAPVNAQTNPALAPSTNPDVPKNLHNWTQNVMIEVMSSMVCQLVGVDPINPNQQCLGVDQKTGKIGFIEGGGGAIGVMGNLIAMTYTPPLHTGDYFGYLAQNFGVAKPAYAQNRTGTGFDGIKPLLNLWVAFRNLVYLLFVAAFAVVGFGIMLRINIDPRTVMTIANQLPKMIIAILLVTFSFAISGFLIDLMYVSIYVTTNVIGSADPEHIKPELAQAIAQSSTPFEAANLMGAKSDALGEYSGAGLDAAGLEPLNAALNLGEAGGLSRIAGLPADSMGILATPLFDNTIGRTALGFFTGVFAAVVAPKASRGIDKLLENVGSWTGASGKIVTWTIRSLIFAVTAGTTAYFADSIGYAIVSLIIFIALTIAILWALFRLTLELIKAYVSVLVHVLLAPFWIVFGLIPASPIGFGGWFREIVGNLSVFPVTIGMFLLGRVLMTAFEKTSSVQFAPPMTGNPNASSFAPFIGLGLILLTPQVALMIKDLIKSPQFKHSGAIAQAVGFGLGAINLPQQAQKVGMMGYYTGQIKNFPGLKGLFGREGTTTTPSAPPR